MKKQKNLAEIVNDTVWYIPRPSIKYAQEIGTYASYDIAAYDCFTRDIVAIALDVTSDRGIALHIIEKLNRHQLSPIHLEEVIRDMLN